MLCKNCKNEIRDGSEFCKHCGQKVEKEAGFSFCTSCGKQIKSNSLFCKHCGASVEKRKTPPVKDDKNNKRSLAVKAIIIALLVVVGLSVLPHNEGNIGDQAGQSSYGGGAGETGASDAGGSGPSPMPGKPSDNNDCFICGGDGEKDCTSCDGGYITEYETGTYMGYGSSTREVRKKCMVCKGNGEVKCYH